MSFLTSHCHERLKITKMVKSGGREWRENGEELGRLLQNEWVPPLGCALGCSSVWEAK